MHELLDYRFNVRMKPTICKGICAGAFSALRVNSSPSPAAPSRWSHLPSRRFLQISSTASFSCLHTSRSSGIYLWTVLPAAIVHRSSYACSGNGRRFARCLPRALTSATETGRLRTVCVSSVSGLMLVIPAKTRCAAPCFVTLTETTTNMTSTISATLTFISVCLFVFSTYSCVSMHIYVS